MFMKILIMLAFTRGPSIPASPGIPGFPGGPCGEKMGRDDEKAGQDNLNCDNGLSDIVLSVLISPIK